MMAIVISACILAFIPALLFHRNLRLYAPLPPASRLAQGPSPGNGDRPAISVLIPARNEAASIRAAVEAALNSRGVTLEVIVLDDHSEDATAAIVRRLAAADRRVRPEAAPPLPAGWCGKQHACATLAQQARHPLLAFVDADVRLAPDGLARMVAFLGTSRADLISGVPRQETVTPGEKLLIALIHFLLLGFLPLWRMRRSSHPAYASGCGQLFMTTETRTSSRGGVRRFAPPCTTASPCLGPFAIGASRRISSMRRLSPHAVCIAVGPRSGGAWQKTPGKGSPPPP